LIVDSKAATRMISGGGQWFS